MPRITKARLFKYIENFTSKNWKLNLKNVDTFQISAQNINCGNSLEPPRRGGSNEYQQFMFLTRNKKNNVYPCRSQFYYQKWGLKGSKLYSHVFVMGKAALRISCVSSHNNIKAYTKVMRYFCIHHDKYDKYLPLKECVHSNKHYRSIL